MAAMSKDGTTAAQIIRDWLVSNGYQGLCNPDVECGCGVDDINPCAWPCNLSGCVCAYLGRGDDGEDRFFISRDDAEASMEESPAFLMTPRMMGERHGA